MNSPYANNSDLRPEAAYLSRGFVLYGLIGLLTVLAILGWVFRKSLVSRSRTVWQSFINKFDRRSFFDTAEVFFHEAAVLWAVFPFLDSIYDLQKGQQPNWYLVLLSFIVAAILFLFGAAFSKMLEEEEDRA